MFDISFQFNPTFAPKNNSKIDELAISSCAIHYFSDNRLWSTFDECSFNRLNRNDYGYGVIDFEIGFTGYSGAAYPKVYTKCFRLLTDGNDLIKPCKISNESSLSKINKNGETVVGIRYYFKSEKEIDALLNCKQLLIESFFALEKKTNTYAFACQMQRDENNQWQCILANTYRMKKRENISFMMD